MLQTQQPRKNMNGTTDANYSRYFIFYGVSLFHTLKYWNLSPIMTQLYSLSESLLTLHHMNFIFCNHQQVFNLFQCTGSTYNWYRPPPTHTTLTSINQHIWYQTDIILMIGVHWRYKRISDELPPMFGTWNYFQTCRFLVTPSQTYT